MADVIPSRGNCSLCSSVNGFILDWSVLARSVSPWHISPMGCCRPPHPSHRGTGSMHCCRPPTRRKTGNNRSRIVAPKDPPVRWCWCWPDDYEWRCVENDFLLAKQPVRLPVLPHRRAARHGTDTIDGLSSGEDEGWTFMS